MARKTNDNNLKPVIDAYQEWIAKCLITDNSLLSSGKLSQRFRKANQYRAVSAWPIG